MLDQLSVKNLVVVEDLNIEFLHGMTVITGETGAGKSILVQALNLAIGGRSDATLVRNGKSKAEIIAIVNGVLKEFHAVPVHNNPLSFTQSMLNASI